MRRLEQKGNRLHEGHMFCKGSKSFPRSVNGFCSCARPEACLMWDPRDPSEGDCEQPKRCNHTDYTRAWINLPPEWNKNITDKGEKQKNNINACLGEFTLLENHCYPHIWIGSLGAADPKGMNRTTCTTADSKSVSAYATNANIFLKYPRPESGDCGEKKLWCW